MRQSWVSLMAVAGALLLGGGVLLYHRSSSSLVGPDPASRKNSVATEASALIAPGTAPADATNEADAARALIDRMDPDALRTAVPLVYLARSAGAGVGGVGPEGSLVMNEKFMGRGVTVPELLAVAYGVSRSRLRLPEGKPWPEVRYDYLVTLDSGQREALQRAIRERLGLVAHPETREEEVFVMTAQPGDFENRRPSEENAGGTRVNHSDRMLVLRNAPMRALVGNLERLLGAPVVDESGLRGRFDMTLEWEPADVTESLPPRPKPEQVRQATATQLGLDLRPDRRALEVVVVEAAHPG